MSIAQSLACSLYDPATGTVVQINRIHQDSEFSFGGSDEEDAAGNGVFNGEEATVDLHFYDNDAAKITQLRTWQEAETPVRLMAVGSKSSIIWDHAVSITLQEPKSFSPLTRSTFMIHMVARGVNLPIWKGENLAYGFVVVQGFETGWQDANNDDLPDGYSVAGTFGTYSFINEIFDTGNVSSGSPGLEINRPFPVSGVTLTSSGNVQKQHNDAISVSLIQQLNYASSILDTENIAYSGTGRSGGSVKTQPGIYSIIYRCLTLQGPLTSDNVQFLDPSLRADGSTDYVAG